MDTQAQVKWHHDFLELALWWGQKKSKDPSTKVGAVIVRPNLTVASLGYNGFPRGVADLQERLTDRAEKYPRTMHAELNAILSANEPVRGYTMYVSPLHPCAQCSGAIIQAGIACVYSVLAEQPERWSLDGRIAKEMLDEAGVHLFALREREVL